MNIIKNSFISLILFSSCSTLSYTSETQFYYCHDKNKVLKLELKADSTYNFTQQSGLQVMSGTGYYTIKKDTLILEKTKNIGDFDCCTFRHKITMTSKRSGMSYLQHPYNERFFLKRVDRFPPDIGD